MMFAFGVEELTTTENDVVGGVIVLLVAFGPAATSFTYCTSFLFSSPAYCNVLNIIIGFLIGVSLFRFDNTKSQNDHLTQVFAYIKGFGGTVLVFLLWFLGNGWNESSGGDDAFETGMNPKENLIVAARVLTWILRMFPSFCLGNGLFYAINLGGGEDFVKGGDVTSVWDSSVLLYEVTFLVLETILYLALAIQLDQYTNCPKSRAKWNRIAQLFRGRFLVSPEAGATYTTVDDDVTKEQDRVEGGASSDLIVMKNLSKRYGNGKLAVNNLSLGIPAGECFGLLGINGAG